MITATLDGTGLILSGNINGPVLTIRRDARGRIEVLDAGAVLAAPLPDVAVIDAGRVRGGGVDASVTVGPGGLAVTGSNARADRLAVDAASRGGATLSGMKGDDTLIGGAFGDSLHGGEGDDSLLGGGGDDRLNGGLGNDLLNGGDGVDTAVFGSNSGLILDLRQAVQVTVLGRDTLLGIENLTSGNGADRLTGTGGRNVLDGGGGNDTMEGLGGDDDYIVNSTLDMVIEAEDGGWDRVFASASYVLPSGVEALILTGTGRLTGTGNDAANLLTGNDAANTLIGGGGDDTLDGGGRDVLDGGLGDDTYLVDADDVVLEYDDGGFDRVISAVSCSLLANVEALRLTGTAAASAVGNTLDNLIEGNAGANTLQGGGGADTLIGGAGDDLYEWTGTEVVIEVAGGGRDTLVAYTDAVLPDHVEVLRLGGPGALKGTGNGLANRIEGNDDDNVLTGGDGSDTLVGGLGNDTYVLTVRDTADRILEAADGGIDTVIAAFSMALPAGVENLTLTGGGALWAQGNALGNRIMGNSGNNTLTGGVGSDTMNGGSGADVYYADADDLVFEAQDGFIDTVYCTGSMDLGAGIEQLVLTGTGASIGRGNALANRITGNGAANILDGRGGADTLIGGLGDDSYFTDGGDLIIEAAGGGSDTIISSVSLTLPAQVERLMLGPVGALTGRGNGLNNLIVGNASANLLDGGAGADTLMGGAGDDTYIADPLDMVVELAGGGRDTVLSDRSWTLGAELEVLRLQGTGAVNGTGNGLANLIVGNRAANVLTGLGGRDTLEGGGGNDLYISDGFDVIIERVASGVDTVRTTGSMTLAANVENLTAATDRGLALTGNSAANRITGGGGADTLTGLGGRDTLVGGGGNDTYRIDAEDVVVEAAGAGFDTIISSTSLSLPYGVEALTLTGSGSIRGTGNGLDNRITGNAAANVLDGLGGRDTLIGGGGNDTYILRAGDTVIEAVASGVDLVQAHVSWTMSANVENLALMGTAQAGTGNGLANRISGNAMANTLSGGGGADTLQGWAGNDRLIGGPGNDVLYGGAGADRFVFNAGDGVDRVWDFQNGLDRFEIARGAERFADLTISQQGAHVLVSFAGGGFWVQNTSRALIDAGDFAFV